MSNRARFNNDEICFICARRAMGLAVGKLNRLGWFCTDCGVDTAQEAYHMTQKEFDVFEERAIEKIAKALGETDLNVPREEMPQFIKWIVQDFAENIRNEVKSGGAPF